MSPIPFWFDLAPARVENCRHEPRIRIIFGGKRDLVRSVDCAVPVVSGPHAGRMVMLGRAEKITIEERTRAATIR